VVYRINNTGMDFAIYINISLNKVILNNKFNINKNLK